MAYVDGDRLSRVWHDWYEVDSNDSKLVAVDVELEAGLDGGVGKTEPVLLTLGDGHLEALPAWLFIPNIHAVDKASVQGWVGMLSRRNLLCPAHDRVSSLVRPVLHHDHLLVVVFIARLDGTVDDDRAKDTIVGLKSVMRVPPGATIGSGNPLVREAFTRSDRTLRNGWNAVILVGVILMDTVEMDSSAIATVRRQAVLDVDNDGVSPTGVNHWAWHLAVHEKAGS